MKIDPYKIKWAYGASRGKNHAALFIDAVGSLAMREHYPEKIYGFPYVGKFYLQANGTRCIAEEDHNEMEKIIEALLKKQPDFFYVWGSKMENVANQIRTWTDEVKNTDWSKTTNDELFKIIYEHCDLSARLWSVPLAYLYYFYFNDKVVEGFVEALKKRLGQKFDEILPAIVTQEKISEIAEEKKELFKLALKEIKDSKLNDQFLTKHWKKFAHLNNYYYWGNGYSLSDMKNRLEDEMKKGEEIIKKELEEFKPKVLDYTLFSEEEAALIKAMKKLSYAFQYADETLAYVIHNIRGAYKESAKRLRLTYDQFVEMLLLEIKQSLQKGKSVVSKNDLDERYNDHVLVISKDKNILLIGEECKRYVAHVFKDDKTGIKEFKGIVAFKGGVIQGAVHIISHADEISSFGQGEILVTPMTNPSFVPAMQKAKAIITNDGGLLCHAAIVSRELKVPCIIGTKIATKVLKDGDLVEVDAERGIVTILKKK